MNVVDPLVSLVISNAYENIGVIATKATINSNIYRDKIKSKLQQAKVHSLATPLLAPMIEEGFFKGEISQSVIRTYLGRGDFMNIDALLLACTHYPLIKKEIQSFIKDKLMFWIVQI